MKQVTNLHTQPLTLDDGTVLAAAGTKGATKSIAELSARDEKRLLRRGLISVIEGPKPNAPEEPAAQSPKSKVQSPEAQVKERQ